MRSTSFNIQITNGDDGLFLASALGYIGGGNTVKDALDAWVDAILDDAVQRTLKTENTKIGS